jgi:hypothetical protein
MIVGLDLVVSIIYNVMAFTTIPFDFELKVNYNNKVASCTAPVKIANNSNYFSKTKTEVTCDTLRAITHVLLSCNLIG